MGENELLQKLWYERYFIVYLSLFHLDANILASIYENANRRHYNK